MPRSDFIDWPDRLKAAEYTHGPISPRGYTHHGPGELTL
jgi:hypothetical protein